MATLSAEVTTRVADEVLVQLTNQGARGSGLSVVTAVLDAAVADAGAEFLLETGLALDTSVASHVMAGVQGVLYYLHSYTGMETQAQQQRRNRWQQLLRLADRTVGGGQRVLPQTNSTLEEAVQNPSGSRPDFGRDRLDDLVPNMPRGDDELETRVRG